MSSIKQIMRNRSLSRSSGGAKRIATSAIPKVDDKTLQTWVKSIDSAVKEVLKQSLTFNDLVNIGLVKFDNGKLTSLIPKEEEVNLTVPLAILNLSARGAYGSVTVIWNTPKSSLFGMNIVYRSELNDFGTAVQVGSTAGDVYTDYIGNNHKVYYWVRTVSKYGVEGHLSPSAYAATSIDIDYLLENLNEKIDESLLDQALRGKIEDTADGLANEEQNRISEDLRVGLEIAREAKERALAIANESKLLNQKIAEETQNLINQIENQSNTLSQDTINRVLALQEEIQSKINTLNNGITTETENRIDEDNAIASSLTAYKTSNNNAVSTVLSKAESAITANNALSSRLDALVASLTESDGTTIDANAFNAMRAEVTTLNGTVSTLVEDVTALENSYSSALDLINTHGSAINTLQTKLTEMGNVVTQSANDITILKSDMGTVKNGLSTKAEAEAVENLETRVTKTEDSQSALSRDVTNLSASITAQAVGDAITGTKDAINALKIVGDLSKVSLVDEPTATTGKVIRLGGNNGNDYLPATSNTFIPIRADRLYRIKYRFRRFAGTSNVYIGLICANSDKTKGITRTNQEKDIDLISSEMFAVSGLSPTTMQWVEGEFYFKGRSTSASTGLGTKESPMTYPAKASYMRLCLISGYLTGAGQYDFDYIILEDAEIIALNDAQASALSSTQAQVVEIDGRVKSSADDLTSLKGRVETAESSLTQKVDTSAMENIYTKTESDNAIAGQISSYNASLVIGGTNLLNNTMVLSNSSDTYRGGKIYRQTRTAAQSPVDTQDFGLALSDLDAEDYTLSFDIKSSIDVPSMSSNLSYFFAPNSTIKVVTSQGYTATNSDGRAEKRVTTSWQRIWITWTQSSATDAKNLIINRIFGNGLDYTVDIANIKFEKGNKATAWTPSPRDTQAWLDANALAIQSTNADVSRIDGVVTSQASDLLKLNAGMTNLNNSKLDASVIQQYRTAADQDSVTSSSLMTMRAELATGARNFVRNTGTPQQGFFWMFQQPLTEKLTGEITISFDVEALDDPPVGYTGGGVGFNMGDGGGGGFNYVWYPNLATKGHLTHTLTVDSGDFTHFGIYANNYVKITNVMVQRGGVDYPWAAAPEDNEAAIDANAQAIRNTETAIATVDGKVNAHATDILNLGTGLTNLNNAKLDASVIQQYRTAVDQDSVTTSALTQFKSELKIGGVNVLLNSKEPRSGVNEYLDYETSVELKNFYDQHLNKDVTISCEIFVPVAGSVKIYTSNSSAHYFEHNTLLPANQWTRVVATVKPIPHDTNPNWATSSLEFYGEYGTGRIVTVRNVQLESGNVATDWSPSPRDYEKAANLTAEALENVYTKTEANEATTGLIQSFNANLKIGGTNIFSSGTVLDAYNVYIHERSHSVQGNKLAFGTGNTAARTLRFNNVVDSLGWYTVSGFVRGNQGIAVPFAIDFCDQGRAELVSRDDDTDMYFEVSVNIQDTPHRFMDIEPLGWLNYVFTNIKIEKGNKATAWSPALNDTADATALTQTRAEVSNLNGQVSAQSNQLTQLKTTVNGYSATIQSHAASIDGMRTQFTLKMDVNGLVSGIGMMNDGVTSDFIVNANTFAIGSPTSNFRPFIATSTETIINGVPAPAGVHINTALIANGTIKNAQIGDLSADKITTGDIHADRMKANIVKAVEGQFDNLGAITAKIGHLRTADTGARIEFKGNLLSFFDNDDTGVILIGEWEEDPIGG